MVRAPVAAHGDDVRVLDDQELIGDLASLALLRQPLLKIESFGVTYPAQIPEFTLTH
jgi:hypothetical protein